MAAAKAHGGPTIYTKATVPDWDGYYQRDAQADHGSEWIWGISQAPTVLFVLTPEYRKRMVQLIYHEAVTNTPQWNASFCYPEGFIRWWAQPSQAGNFQLTRSTWNVQFISGIADNFLRQVMVGKEQHVQKVLQWYGETIGFWDGTTLVIWTANIQGCTLTRLRKKSLSIPNAKSSTRLDALYAIAEPWGYISLPPDFAISRARKTFSAACDTLHVRNKRQAGGGNLQARIRRQREIRWPRS